MSADVRGALHHEFGGREYTLRLTFGGIAKLQGKYGNDIGGFLTEKGIEGVPPFGLLIDIVSVALEKGEGMAPEDANPLADDMLTADLDIVQRLLAATFPDAVGNATAPKKVAAA